jgi:hypothetical protein
MAAIGLVLTLLVSSGVARGRGASGLLAQSTKPRVRTTLDGRSLLPFRIRWIAIPTDRGSVSEVDFLIDGKLIWKERNAPYVFGGDEHGAHKGFLFTSWLSARRHRFTARARYKGGGNALDTVVARVKTGPTPPAALAGAWTRIVTKADLKKSGPLPPPAGRWDLVFDRAGAWELDPLGSGLANAYQAGTSTLTAYAPIQMAPLNNGKTGITKYGHHNLGGTDCFNDGPSGTYTWSVTDNQLTLTATSEKCGNRRAVWEGVWTRTKTP